MGRKPYLALLNDLPQLVQHLCVDKALFPDHPVILVLAVVCVAHLHQACLSAGHYCGGQMSSRQATHNLTASWLAKDGQQDLVSPVHLA